MILTKCLLENKNQIHQIRKIELNRIKKYDHKKIYNAAKLRTPLKKSTPKVKSKFIKLKLLKLSFFLKMICQQQIQTTLNILKLSNLINKKSSAQSKTFKTHSKKCSCIKRNKNKNCSLINNNEIKEKHLNPLSSIKLIFKQSKKNINRLNSNKTIYTCINEGKFHKPFIFPNEFYQLNKENIPEKQLKKNQSVQNKISTQKRRNKRKKYKTKDTNLLTFKKYNFEYKPQYFFNLEDTALDNFFQHNF